MNGKATVGTFLFLVIANVACAGERFDDTGLSHCKRFDEDRTPVPVWSANLDESWGAQRPSPPPTRPGGTIVYFSLYTGPEVDENYRCKGAPEHASYVLNFPNEKDKQEAGGVRLHLRGPAEYKNGTCILSGFYFSRPASGIRRGWTDLYYVAADEIPLASNYCLADINPNPRPRRPKVLPVCDRAPAYRTPVPVWNPQLTARGELTSAPPQGDGMIVSISIDTKKDAEGICSGWADGAFKFLAPNHPGTVTTGGLAVTLQGNDSSGPDSCQLFGFYMNEPRFDTENGWTKTYFGSVNQDRVVDSGQYCLVP